MFQKILVVLVGLVMSLVGALTPDTLFASQQDAAFGSPSLPAIEQSLATIREADGAAFSKVPVLWVEVDGRRVLDDAWGTGEVKELRFKVGVKDVESGRLAIGDKLIPLHPMDVLTVRTFRGDFAYRGMGTAAGTLQLQGQVQTTTLNEGPVTGKLRTESTLPRETDPSRPARLAYVVLDSGESLDTVRVDDGGDRFFTQEAAGSAKVPNAPGNLLAKWVKIDGQLVREYTWGNGAVPRIEFEPASANGNGAILAFEGSPVEALPGSHAIVKEFVGEYLVYQVEGNLVRLRLDGYAEDFTTGADDVAGLVSTGPGAPLAGFELSPPLPKTSDTVTFHDRSTDEGIVVFWRWDFGDGVVSALQEPTHRFARPGTYNVTLSVTDDDLQTTTVSRLVQIKNAEPVASFDFAPKIVSSDTIVAFTDLSLDTDGSLANWTWDFGDGKGSFARHPTHRFAKSGPLTVSLTVRDELGGVKTTTRSLLVRNHAPVAAFEWGPVNAISNSPVTFKSLSFDADGRIVDWAWDFDGDGAPDAKGDVVAHTFTRPGEHVATLTVTDDSGAIDTANAVLGIENRPPVAEFTWTPNGGPVTAPVHFTNLATDPDGFVVLSEWDWGDGSSTRLVTPDPVEDARTAPQDVQYDVSRPSPPDAEHTYASPGEYVVKLCVTDNMTKEACVTHTVPISNSAPVARVAINPNPVYRGVAVLVDTTLSSDPDKEPIASRLIEFGDGATATQPAAQHVYRELCSCVVKVTVRDAEDNVGTTTRILEVLNRPPEGKITLSREPVVGANVWFNATEVRDYDDSPGAFNYTWRFLPSQTPWYGASVQRVFTDALEMQAVLVIRDGEGANSSGIYRSFSVQVAPPTAAFTFSPEVPNIGQTVTFTDGSSTFNPGGITERHWNFAGEGTSTETNPTHAFTTGGTREVTLEVRDASPSGSGFASRIIPVNSPPRAQFAIAPHGVVRPGDVVTFIDSSTDPEGEADIRIRHWDFGDGTLDTTDTNVGHAFSRPGTFIVRLTVEDQHGLTSTTTASITIQNRGPIVAWHIESTPPFRRGDAIQFVSDSVDPDGSTLVYRWVWGDGTETVGPDPRPIHTFATSGTFNVHLEVSDGELRSPVNAGTATVRIWGREDVTLDFSALLPHNALVDLTLPGMVVEIKHQSPNGIAKYTGVQLSSPTPQHKQVTLPGGTWAQGDLITATVFDGRWMNDPRWTSGEIRAGKQAHLSDLDGALGMLAIVAEDQLPVVPTVHARAERTGSLDNTHTSTSAGEAYYGDLSEAYHGEGTVAFLDGVIARDAEITVQLRYLPLILPTNQSARDLLAEQDDVAPTGSTNANNLIGWCTAAVVRSDQQGAFTWSTTNAANACTIDGSVGRWQVRAIARFPGAMPTTSVPENFYVDPTGLLRDRYVP